ncbi:MAG: hypothetical protein MUD09_03525, partial [Desulfobacterales bacterium]|nr:hypothetical protein [Desulfobacterales bacterium]
NRFYLQGCEPEQALELVSSRLKVLFGDDDLFPFEKSKLLETFKAGGVQSPRRFITLANEMLNNILGMTPDTISVADQIKAEYSRQLENVIADINQLGPDRNRLRRAMLLYIESLPSSAPYRVREVKSLFQKDKYTDFMCRIVYPGNRSINAVFIIDTEDHHSSVSASLKRGLDFFNKFPDGKAFYIRDSRCPFPDSSKWPETNKIRRQFQSAGGKLLFFDKQQAAAWYALALLSYSIKEGDITITDPYSFARPAKWDEFLGVVREILSTEGRRAFETFDDAIMDKNTTKDQSGISSDDQEVADRSVELLKESGGMMMMTAARLRENLNTIGFQVNKDQVLSVLSFYQDRFGIIPTKDDMIVLLKKDWLYAQC